MARVLESSEFVKKPRYNCRELEASRVACLQLLQMLQMTTYRFLKATESVPMRHNVGKSQFSSPSSCFGLAQSGPFTFKQATSSS